MFISLSSILYCTVSFFFVFCLDNMNKRLDLINEINILFNGTIISFGINDIPSVLKKERKIHTNFAPIHNALYLAGISHGTYVFPLLHTFDHSSTLDSKRMHTHTHVNIQLLLTRSRFSLSTSPLQAQMSKEKPLRRFFLLSSIHELVSY